MRVFPCRGGPSIWTLAPRTAVWCRRMSLGSAEMANSYLPDTSRNNNNNSSTSPTLNDRFATSRCSAVKPAEKSGEATPSFTVKTPFEDFLQRLFKTSALRVDLAPVKRPLLEGSVSFDVGKIKITLMSALCGNSKEQVEERLRERAELLAAEFYGQRSKKTEKESITRLLLSHVGHTLPQLLNHLDIQLHIKFSLNSDVISLNSEELTQKASSQKYFQCCVYTREVWDAQMQWNRVARVVSPMKDDSAVSPTSDASSLLAAMKAATSQVEHALQGKREEHYFESMREAELLLGDVAMPCVLDSVAPMAFCKPVGLRTSLIQSKKGTALALKATVADKHGNETACGTPLSGSHYALINKKIHICLNCQYSSIGDSSNISEVELKSLKDSNNERSAEVPSYSSLPLQRALRHVFSQIPTIWYERRSLCMQTDILDATSMRREGGASSAARRPFTHAAAVYTGSLLYEEWWQEYCRRRSMPSDQLILVNLPSCSKFSEKVEEKVSFCIGWRSAPCLHNVADALLIAFAVWDTRKRVFALGTSFHTTEEFFGAIADNDEMRRPYNAKSIESGGTVEGGAEGNALPGAGSSAALCSIEIISVADTLRNMGVSSGAFDPQTSTLELNIEEDGGKKSLTFSQLNKPSGVSKLFRFCKNASRQLVYHTLQLHPIGSTFCRTAQRLLAVAFIKGKFVKPGLRGKVLPVPIPFTSDFMTLSFTSNLQREVFSVELLKAIEPFCRLPAEYPISQWPAASLPPPCYFNFWGPTKRLLKRLGNNYYCYFEQEGAEDAREGPSSLTLCVCPGNQLVDGDALTIRVPISCTDAAELPILVLKELDTLVNESTPSQNVRTLQVERLQKLLCDRSIPREITLSNAYYWLKAIRLLFDKEEYYERGETHSKLLIDLAPSLKPVELAAMETSKQNDGEWRQMLAAQYAEKHLLPLLKPVDELVQRGLVLLGKLPVWKDTQISFSLMVRANMRESNFIGALSGGSNRFRKDVLQGVPCASPFAAFESIVCEMEALCEEKMKELVNSLYEGMTIHDNTGSEEDSSCSLSSAFHEGDALKKLSPYLQEVQKEVKALMNMRDVVHQYNWSTSRLSIRGVPVTETLCSTRLVDLASEECEWNAIPIVLPRLYTQIVPMDVKRRKHISEAEHFLSKVAMGTLERDVHTRISPVTGTTNLFQGIRVAHAVAQSLWYAELKLPAALFKVDSVWADEKTAEEAQQTSEKLNFFYVSCSMNAKRRVLRLLLSDLYYLYVLRSDKTVSLVGERFSVIPENKTDKNTSAVSIGVAKNISSPSPPSRLSSTSNASSSPQKISASPGAETSRAGKGFSFPAPARSASASVGAAGTARPDARAGQNLGVRDGTQRGPSLSLANTGKKFHSFVRSPARVEAKPRRAASEPPPQPRKVRPATARRTAPQGTGRGSSSVVEPAASRGKNHMQQGLQASKTTESNFCSVLLHEIAKRSEIGMPAGTNPQCVLSVQGGSTAVLLRGIGASPQPFTTLYRSRGLTSNSWIPHQILVGLVSSLRQCSSQELGVEELQVICGRIRAPNIVLQPSMPAKLFCVFFFHRYFGWPVCDAEDMPHIKESAQEGKFFIFTDLKQKAPLNAPEKWMCRVNMVQVSADGPTSGSQCLAQSSVCASTEEALNSAWEACMMEIVKVFEFTAETNIYQYQSLDNFVLHALHKALVS